MLYVACDSFAEPWLIDTLMCRYIKENADRHEYGELGAWSVHHEMAVIFCNVK